MQLCECVCMCVCVCVSVCAPGSGPSLGWGGTPNQSYFPRLSLSLSWFPSCAQVTYSYPKQPDKDLWPWSDCQADKERQHETDTTETLSESFSPPIFQILSLTHTHPCTHMTGLVHKWLLLPHMYVINVRKARLPLTPALQYVALRVTRLAVRPPSLCGRIHMRPYLNGF